MLRPFEIYSRTVRIGEAKDSRTLRGYLQEQFVNVWHKLLEEPSSAAASQTGISSKDRDCVTVSLAGKESDSADKSGSTREAQNTARSATVSLAGTPASSTPSIPATKKTEPEAQPTSAVNAAGANARVAQPPSAVSSPRTVTSQTENSSKDAACVTVADVSIDPRMKGILADHRNYFRQYPEQSKKNARDIAVLRHHWPQPADDTGPADLIYTLDDGIPIPYTKVNRDPRDPKPLGNIPNIHNKRERWPVLLSDDEKGQVAIARFHEIYAAARAHLEQKKAAAAADREQPSAAVS
jgi:hypothetical protein